MKIILMSDLHQIAGGELYGVDPKRRLQAAIDEINREHADAEAVVLLGDNYRFGGCRGLWGGR